MMNATHKLFLKDRSVYILLLEARNDKDIEKQVRDWINEIIITGGDSPIIVVANKIDVNSSFDFNNTFGLLKDYSQIKGFINISCATKQNIDKLKYKLEEIIPNAGFFNSEIDVREIKLKEKIVEETATKDYLSEKEFDKLCKSKDIGLHGKKGVNRKTH